MTHASVNAATPEELFGMPPSGDAALVEMWVSRAYRRLARKLHPDKGGDPAEFMRLNDMYETAVRLIRAGSYGKERPPVITVTANRRHYTLTDRLAVGDFCDVYRCAQGVFKIVRVPRDNDLLRAEAHSLRSLGALEDVLHPFVPQLLGSIAVKQSGGRVRQALLLDNLDGFYSLDDVLRLRATPLDGRDMAWMWRRLLFVLGAVHRQIGLTHGAVVPSNVMIHPQKHGLVLIDWAYAVKHGERLKAVSGTYRHLYPDEATGKQPVGPEEDIYMGAKTMLHICPNLPRSLRAYFRSCLLPRRMRPADAWEMQETFDEVLERTYGPRVFRPFSI